MISHKFRLQRFVRTFSLVVLGLVALTAASVSAQNTTGTVRGTVTSSGATVADAQIQLRNPATGVQRGTTSREDGSFTLAGLPPASYEMTVRRIGSTPQTRVVVVQIGATQIQNFAISDQAAQLEAVVVSAAAAIETRTSESAQRHSGADREAADTEPQLPRPRCPHSRRHSNGRPRQHSVQDCVSRGPDRKLRQPLHRRNELQE